MAGSRPYIFVLRMVNLALLLTEEDVKSLLPMREAVDLMEETFRQQGLGKALNRSRERLRYQGGMMHYMAGAPDNRSAGLKAYVSTGSGIRFVAVLFDAQTAQVLALLEADWLGRIRTGAASGAATKLLSREDARVVGLIGTGRQAKTQAEALAVVRPISVIKVFSRSREARERFARDLAERTGCEVKAVTSAEAAVEDSGIVTTITSSRDPVLHGSWIAPGTHINAAGSNARGRREIDVEAVERSSCIAVDSLEQAKRESGDLIEAAEAGRLDWQSVHELGEIAVDTSKGRRSPQDITLFESQGVAIEDVAAARFVYERALQEGRGQEIRFGAAEG